jgi:hypothetical protein
MKKMKMKPPFVAGLEPRPSAPARAPAVQPNVRAVKRCPVCNQNPGVVEVSIGPLLTRICSPCFERFSKPVEQVRYWANVLQRFL